MIHYHIISYVSYCCQTEAKNRIHVVTTFFFSILHKYFLTISYTVYEHLLPETLMLVT